MSDLSRYTKYRISKSLNGNTIVYLARAGKHLEIVGRASSKEKLIKQMSDMVKMIKEEEVAKQRALAEKQKRAKDRKKKRLGLWKPGRLLSKDKDDESSAELVAEETTEVISTIEDLDTATKK